MEKMSQRERQQHIACLIWQHLPIEFLPPERRHVADVSADEVYMLHAGLERLQFAPDSNESKILLHAIESDASRAQSKHAQLSGNGEGQITIDEENLLTWKWLISRPELVVGTICTDLCEAETLLAHVLRCVAIGGYIGLLLPRSLLTSRSWDGMRQVLFSGYDLLELWSISEDQLASETGPLVVILAQRREEHISQPEPILVRHILSLEQMPQGTGVEIWNDVPAGLLFTADDWREWLAGSLPHQLPEAERAWMTHEPGWNTCGVIDHVTVQPPCITFWMEGFGDEPEEWPTVPIVSSMPGWMLRSDAPFDTRFPRLYRKQRSFAEGARAWDYFRPQAYMYLSEEELLEGISNQFQTSIND